MSKTITVSVEEQAEKQFRRIARIKYGKHKGYLGKAISSAMMVWMEKQEQEDINLKAIERLRKGFNLGGITYKNRGELHDR